MRIYNTESHKIEEFIPIDPKCVKMYTCGPTVYHYAHIGNLRNYIMHDVLEKTLNYIGYNVKRVMNITDVGHLSSDSDTGEDKMVKGAKREHKTVMEIAKFYTDAFFDDCSKLNIKKPEFVEPATKYIDEYFKLINGLLEKGYAYNSNGNIYFDTSKLDDYYRLTNHKEDEMVIGAREGVEEDKNKKNQNDFVLWFTKSKFDDQELKWESPWGLGYPGWHIECSCIALKNLGERLDIHGGGVDNIFPHHTNEIAQTESYIGHKWCNYWFHNEHLNDKFGKMSKSNGEFLTLSLLIDKGYNPLSYRYMCLTSHYRKQLVFSYEAMDANQNTYNKLLRRISEIKNNSDGNLEEDKIKSYQSKFKEALENDLNTSNAITVLFDLLKDEEINNKSKIYLINDFDKVLSLDLLKDKEIDNELKKYIEECIEKRNEAKKNKDYILADKIRDELKEKGILLKDTREETTYELM